MELVKDQSEEPTYLVVYHRNEFDAAAVGVILGYLDRVHGSMRTFFSNGIRQTVSQHDECLTMYAVFRAYTDECVTVLKKFPRPTQRYVGKYVRHIRLFNVAMKRDNIGAIPVGVEVAEERLARFLAAAHTMLHDVHEAMNHDAERFVEAVEAVEAAV